MSWNGYFRLGPAEFINKPRTYAYARALGLSAVRGVDDNLHLGPLLGETYSDPSTDLPPWADPDNEASYEFAGIIPLEVSGLEDSTRTSETFEFTEDGGNPGRVRHTTKAVVFNVALVGKTEASVEHGFRWLKRALLPRPCADSSQSRCKGQDLTYLRSAPSKTAIQIIDGGNPDSPGDGEVGGDLPSVTADPIYGGELPGSGADEEWFDYERHLRNVTVSRGPTITAKKKLPGCNGHMWVATFTATAGDPFEYGYPRPVLEGFGDGTDPYVAGLTGAFGSTTYDEEPCPVSIYTPIFDPTCPALVPPPPPPDILTGCFELDPGVWDRQYAAIPESLVPLWDEARPIITVKAGTTEARMVRVRFYDSDGNPGAECGALGEFVISYVPALHTLVIDTVAEAVYAYTSDGIMRRADSLVYGNGEAKPIKWFGLTCGDAYTVTLDRPQASLDPVEVSLNLAPRSA